MRINDTHLTGSTERAAGTQAPGGVSSGGRRAGVERTGDGDQIQLSNLSHALQSQESNSPERTSRVAKLQSDVQSGRYQIDNQDLSRKLVDDALKGGLG